MEAEKESPQYRIRTSRLAKWKELVVVAQKELDLPPKAPDAIMLLASKFADGTGVCVETSTATVLYSLKKAPFVIHHNDS